MNINQVLIDLGLQDKEPEIFMALLTSTGPQPASSVSKKTEINRTTVYKALIKMAKMGLITKTMQHGVICFLAEEPDKKLEDFLIKKQKQLASLSQNLLNILPEIKDLEKQQTLVPKMRYYEGMEGVKRVYRDTLKEGKTIYGFENVAEMADEAKDYILNDYVPKRAEAQIHAYVIVPKNKENENFQKKDKESLRETRIISQENFPVETEINIYGQKTAFFSYKAGEMFGVILESEAIANSMKAIFNFCWKFSV